jgi:hypothetical protein
VSRREAGGKKVRKMRRILLTLLLLGLLGLAEARTRYTGGYFLYGEPGGEGLQVSYYAGGFYLY